MTPRPTYRKPYPEYFDVVDLGRNPKIPEFTKFSGEDKVSTIEHIAHFIVQCGNLDGLEAAKLRLFPNSLTGLTFTWYFNLPANSNQSWQEMEELFHTQFYRTEPEITIGDLAKLTQESGEAVDGFITRFKTAKYKCLSTLPETEYARMALGGLSFELRKRFAGNSEQKQVDYIELDVDAVEIAEGKSYVCKALVRPNDQARQAEPPKTAPQRTFDSKVTYSFDISKAELIFDQLLKDKQIKLLPGH
ncbi:uncharacterized protein LOC122650885 [Telopea speciosissima]|uniref:uncharacterized protein LOC122650885 n=1 Tax=Telopea speciosissima TaxID=54955 RepID=UPI001CC339EE|nr:uncharacterized protein LOC122650885 [Telopea speciosissima]